MQVLPAATRQWVPWKNGGGMTSDVAIGPDGAATDDFDWRVSIARIDRDGPFSMFPGVDRTLTLLSGGPLTLAGPDWEITLSEGSDPVAFDGADSVHARTAAPGTDLNVMSVRARCRHTLRLLALPVAMPPGEQLMIAIDGGIACNGIPLQPMDAVLADAGDSIALDGPSGARLWAVAIDRR
jgi:environmental stress-induced protein Ves